MSERSYIAIDLKSFYASVECIQRGLDPLTANLVVADPSRTEKTICLAVSPALKSFGIPGRPRLFEVVQKVEQINANRRQLAPGRTFTGASTDASTLNSHPELALDYIVAPPQMALYMETSAAIYGIYLKHVAPEDIHVYSVDEVFIDATPYLKTYGLTARQFAQKLIQEVLNIYGITATAGIGTNLYLCKVAMDIVAKKIKPDKNGVRIAQLDELSYRQTLWEHKPITDFWRVGPGYARKLAKIGLFTMGDVARCSLGQDTDFHNQERLFKIFGIQAELLIDHAWGIEPCTIADIKAYKPESNSISSGQVLHCPYSFENARLIVREMADTLSYDLAEKGLVTDQVVLTVGYDAESLKDVVGVPKYTGPVTQDFYGRSIPKHAHGTYNFSYFTSSTKELVEAFTSILETHADPDLLIRRLTLCANHLQQDRYCSIHELQQLNLFDEPSTGLTPEERQREKRRQQAVITIRKKYGKNAIIKGMNLEEAATAMDRNRQIGGHKA